MSKMKSIKNEKYERLTKEARDGIKKWYRSLWEDTDKQLWLAAEMMLVFAMRKEDVLGATGRIFVDEREKQYVYVHYQPQKTRFSSGRQVTWPIHPDSWKQIVEARQAIANVKPTDDSALVPEGHSVFARLNRSLCDAVPELAGKKNAIDELRKVRIDFEYKNFGAERASWLSGEEIGWLSEYYADLSDLKPMAVRAEQL